MYLVDANGVQVAAYDYDPYGKIIIATGDFAEINPLRYRGYYYDSETGFYYLQSRYYDPEICRFINTDSYASTGQGFIGFNMFAYCNDNPISLSDTSGSIPAYSLMLTDSGSSTKFIPAPNGRTTSFSSQAVNGDRRTTVTYELTYYSPKQVQEKVQNDALAAYVEDPGVSGYGGLIFSEIIGFIVDKIQSESTQPVGTIIEIAAIIAHFIGKGKESIDASKARFWVNAAQSGKGIIEVHYSAYGTSGSYCILWDETSEELGFGAYPMARR